VKFVLNYTQLNCIVVYNFKTQSVLHGGGTGGAPGSTMLPLVVQVRSGSTGPMKPIATTPTSTMFLLVTQFVRVCMFQVAPFYYLDYRVGFYRTGSCGQDVFLTCEVDLPTSTDLVSVPNMTIFRGKYPLVTKTNKSIDKVNIDRFSSKIFL